MEFVALTALNEALLAVILWRGLREKLWADFVGFYVYATFSVVSGLIAVAILFFMGISSPAYRIFYYTASTLTIFVGAWFFFDILRCLSPTPRSGVRLARTFLLAAMALVVPVVWAIVRMEGNPLDRLQAVSLIYKMTVCLVAVCYVVEHREVELGPNVAGILAGMGLLTGFQSLNFISYLSGGIKHDLFQLLVPSLYSGAMFVLLFSLWERDPVRFNDSRRNLDLGFQQGFRVLLRSLLTR